VISPFGIQHGEIKKYSGAYGTARVVEGKQAKRKLRPLPDTKKITIIKKPITKKPVSKARRGPGVTRMRRDPATSMVARGGKKPYYRPSAEQVAAAKVRRSAQAAASEHYHNVVKPNTPVGGGKKVPWRVHRAASGRMAETLGAISLASAGAGYALHRRTEVAKVDKDKAINTGLGAAAGAGAAPVALNVTSMSTKIGLKNARAKRGMSPNESKVWAQHAAKHGVKDDKGGRKIWRAYSQYPKELPHWKVHRALAFKNRPQVLPATIAAGAIAGGAIGAHKTNQARRNG